jgi:FkbM family methyltransferase
MTEIDAEIAWAAFAARNRAFDGLFVGAVKTTGIYCKPSCAARHPLPRNIEYFADGEGARKAGYRACLRCKPDEIGRDREAVAKAIRLIDRAEDLPLLDDLAAAVGYAPHHFHRLFKRDTGVTPAAYARALRAKRTEAMLTKSPTITAALYDAGYQSPSRFYAAASDRLGMTPSAWKSGGIGVTIRYAIVDTVLGKMLLAATEKVKTITLDALCLQKQIRSIDVLKIDVQGFEGRVLAGALKILKESPHCRLFCEFWASGIEGAGDSPASFFELLKKLEFQVYEPVRQRLIPLSAGEAIRRTQGRKYMNIFAKRTFGS